MREAKVMDAVDEAAPDEMQFEEKTTRLDSTELRSLIEKSEGAEVAAKVAMGTPLLGLPQVRDDEPSIEANDAVPDVAPETRAVTEVVHPVMPPSRLVDLAIGGAISFVAMIAWFCATHL